MQPRDPAVYLEDIEYYAAAAIRFISNYSLEQYLADEKTRAAVERVRLSLQLQKAFRMRATLSGFEISWLMAMPS